MVAPEWGLEGDASPEMVGLKFSGAEFELR